MSRKRSIFLDVEAEGEDEEGEEGEEEGDQPGSNIDGLISEVESADRDGHHLRLSARQRLAEEEQELAALEAEGQRLQQATRAAAAAGGEEPEGEFAELARAARRRELVDSRRRATELEAERRRAADATDAAAAARANALRDLYAMDGEQTAPAPAVASELPPKGVAPGEGRKSGKFRIKKKGRTDA